MRKWVKKLWNSYKYRFVPWIALNVKYEAGIQKQQQQTHIKDHLQIHHITKADEKLISDEKLLQILIGLFQKFEYNKDKYSSYDINLKNQSIMHEYFGFSVKRCKSFVSPDAGTGVFIRSGTAKTGSLVGLYPGTIYMPFEPLFFPSIGNPFIFRCADGIHVDGNDKWISKSIYKSCASRDQYDFDVPCCDTSWLTKYPINPLNVGQYVNNRSRTQDNNVVYQESLLSISKSSIVSAENHFPVHLCKFFPNVWSNPYNNHHGLRLILLVATRDIPEGHELLSSYFTVVRD